MMADNNSQKQEKNFTRIIYAIASFTMSIKMFFDIVLKQDELFGLVFVIILLLLAFIFIDRSNVLPFKLNKRDDEFFVQRADVLGFTIVIYLFYLAIF